MHDTSLYIFGQNLESLSKSLLRRSNRHDLIRYALDLGDNC